MPRYKPQHRDHLMVAIDLHEQLEPGSFAFALDHLVDHELDLRALDRRFRNDHTGASAYNPRVMLKIVLLAYSQGLISSRAIERACLRNVQFIAIGGDSQPSHAHIAKFISTLGDLVKALFAQVLMTCDAQGLIGRQMFAIDGVKLPSNASKERSGTHEELRQRASRLEAAAAKIVKLHQSQDNETSEQPLPARRQARVEALRHEAARTREFLATNEPRRNARGTELKTNVTDADSAKMATSKGVIQGYAAQAAVDAEHQIIVAADVTGSGSEQSMLLPMIEQAQAYRQAHTLITADAGYHSEANITALHEQGIPALVADNQMRQRDERFRNQQRYKQRGEVLHDKRPKPDARFKPQDFEFRSPYAAICPAGHTLTSSGVVHLTATGQPYTQYKARDADCLGCALRERCLKEPGRPRGRQVTRFEPRRKSATDPSERMKNAIDSVQGRRLYGQRMATVEPVFANIRHNKRLSRLTLRGREKVGAQWTLYCMVHNIEKLARSGWTQ